MATTPARPLQIITPTYPAANATFNSSHSTLSVMTKEIEVADALMQSITERFSCGVACVCKLCLFLPAVLVARVVVPVSILWYVFEPVCLPYFYASWVYFWVCAWREDTVIQGDEGRWL